MVSINASFSRDHEMLVDIWTDLDVYEKDTVDESNNVKLVTLAKATSFLTADKIIGMLSFKRSRTNLTSLRNQINIVMNNLGDAG